MKRLSHRTLFFMLAAGAIFLPSPVLASTVYISTAHSEFFVGDTVLLSVRIDSEGRGINAIEGELALDHAADGVALASINTSGSAFSLWPGKPLPSERNTRISFAGGSPGGLIAKDAIVFNIALKLQEAGPVALSPSRIGVYLHDGNGTKDEVRTNALVLDVLPRVSDAAMVDDWSHIVSSDKTAPEPFEIYLSQDESVFDGMKFVSFGTTDAQSGISYYEVIEGNLPPVRSSDTHILQEQSKPVRVAVIAYDAAGNARESVYSPPTAPTVSYVTVLILIGILLLIIILPFVAYRKRKMRGIQYEIVEK